MGYYMDQGDSKFIVKKENFDEALKVIKALKDNTNQMHGGSSSTGEKWYSWVEMSELANAKTLHEAIEAWRWTVELDKEENINEIQFEGEKLGDDLVLFKALAPYVEDDSFIEMHGEDGNTWRWSFCNGKCEERYPTTDWG